MADYIDRQEVIETVAFYREDPDGIDHALNSIKSIPSADVQPVKHGRWINICGDSESMRQCSECLQDFDYIDGICYLVSGQRLPLYCPNCGAKMDGET